MRVPRLTFVVSALPRLVLLVVASVFGIGTDVEFDDESDEELVPRMSDDDSDPVDLVRGR